VLNNQDMTSRDFAYWLQGFFEISNPQTIGAAETEMIKKHLNLVFKHEIDPSMGGPEHQAELNKIHMGYGPNQTADYLGFDHTTKYCSELPPMDKKNRFEFATTEEEAIALYGPKPSDRHEFNIHGWYDPQLGVPRC
jgi:hypothetical protein